jgi:hypothetical protein
LTDIGFSLVFQDRWTVLAFNWIWTVAAFKGFGFFGLIVFVYQSTSAAKLHPPTLPHKSGFTLLKSYGIYPEHRKATNSNIGVLRCPFRPMRQYSR